MHEDNKAKDRSMLPVSRRRFVQGLAAGGAVAALDWRAGWAFAETGQQQTLAMLTGKDFELTIDSLPVNFTGRRSVATAVNGSVPGPILRWRQRRYSNHLGHQSFANADFDSLARYAYTGGDGWRARFELCRNRTRQNICLPVSGAAERDVLVSQSQRLSGAARVVGRSRD